MVAHHQLLAELNQKRVSLQRLHQAPADLQQALDRSILTREDRCAPIPDIEPIFGPYRMPGTSSIGLRKDFPQLFQDTLDSCLESYDDWVNRVLIDLIDALTRKRVLPVSLASSDRFRQKTVRIARGLLELRDPEGTPLRNRIPQQIYEDVFVNMLKMVWGSDLFPDAPHLYREFNVVCHRVALALLNRLDTIGCLTPDDRSLTKLIHVAVLSGYVGINLKSSASAASTLLNCEEVPLQEAWIADMESAQAVSEKEIQSVNDRLLALSSGSGEKFGLDSVAAYFEEVVDAREPVLLVFFSDDYMESMIDFKRMEVMLQRNPKLDILLVPRNGRYGNDLAAADLENVLSEPAYDRLKTLQKKGRFHVSASGPMAGCIDPRFVSAALIREMMTLSRDRKLILETKGCRNFEMLQGGITVPWYTSFNCNRALSIRTVGIDFEPVFLRIPPGFRAYDGFCDPVIGNTPSGRSKNVRFARLTTKILYESPAAARLPGIEL